MKSILKTQGEQNKPASINIYNTVSNQNSIPGKYSFGIADAKKTRFKAHIYPLNGCWSLHRRSPHFPADVAQPSCIRFPPWLSSSLGPTYFAVQLYYKECPLTRFLPGMPRPFIPSHGPPFNQPIADGIFILPLILPTSHSKQDAAAHPLLPGSLSPFSSPLQHQANCLQVIHKSIQQFNQHLKGEKLDRQTPQLIVLQLRIDCAFLRHLLFSSIGTTSNKYIAANNSATSPLINPNPNLNPTSTALQLLCADAPKFRRSTPVGAVGTPAGKTNNSANDDFQPTFNMQEAPPTTVQNLTSRISKLENLFTDEIAAYTSITAGIHSQNFFSYDKSRQLEPGNSDVIIWKMPSVKFLFDSTKVARPSSDPLFEPTTSFTSPFFRTYPHGQKFSIKFYPYGIGPATGRCTSILATLFPADYDNLFQRPFSKIISVGVRDQLDPLNTWTKTV